MASDLHPGFPIVDGTHQLTDTWAIDLDQAYNRRVEDGSLVLWRPGFTLWINVWNNDQNESIESRLSAFQNGASSDAYEETLSRTDVTSTFRYRLVEDGVMAMYGLVFASDSHIQIATYFDVESDHITAAEIIDGISYSTP